MVLDSTPAQGYELFSFRKDSAGFTKKNRKNNRVTDDLPIDSFKKQTNTQLVKKSHYRVDDYIHDKDGWS